MLLAGLATGFSDNVGQNAKLTPEVRQLATETAATGIPMVSIPDLENATAEAGLPPDQVEAISNSYGDAQIEALKKALLFTAIFSFAGIWFARKLPTELT